MKMTGSKHLLALALLCCGLAGNAQTAIPKWKIGDLETFMDTTTRPAVINFWATFCKPCIAEIPHFQELVKQYESRGLRLLLVSLDLPEDYVKIPAFAKRRGFTAPIVFLNETNADLFCPKVDAKWSGAIPATLLIDGKHSYRKFFEEPLSREKLQTELGALIGTL